MRNVICTLVFALSLFFISPSFALCKSTPLQRISHHGEVITLINKSIWVADSPHTAVGWNVNDEVLMCGNNQMVNHDQNETISVVRIR